MRKNKAWYRNLSLAFYLLVFILITLIHSTELSRLWFLNVAAADLMNLLMSSASQNNVLMVDQEKKSAVEFKLNKLMESNSNKQERAQYHAGQLAYWSGDYKTTINTLWSSELTNISPLSGWLLGVALWQEGYNDEAVKVLQLVANVEYFFMNQAMLAEAKRSYQVSERSYQVARELMPGEPTAEAGYWFTRCLNLLSNPTIHDEQANFIIRKAISLNENSASRQLQLGVRLLSTDRINLAEGLLVRAEELDPESYWPKYYLGKVYYWKKEYHKAAEKLLETIEMSPNFARGHHWLARTLIRLGKKDLALSHYEKAVDLMPEDGKLKSEFQNYKNEIYKQID